MLDNYLLQDFFFFWSLPTFGRLPKTKFWSVKHLEQQILPVTEKSWTPLLQRP